MRGNNKLLFYIFKFRLICYVVLDIRNKNYLELGFCYNKDLKFVVLVLGLGSR